MLKSPDFVVSTIKALWQPGRKVLEIGCGPSLLRQHFGKDYIGTDITDEPYSSDMARDVDYVCPADNLLIDNEAVDIVVIKSAFFLFTNPNKSLQEAIRVLKPGGHVIIFDYNKRTQRHLQEREGHRNYPCWTQWRLRNYIQARGFMDAKLLLPQVSQPKGIKRIIDLIRQEMFGTWAIVIARKMLKGEKDVPH
jgi:ubiquinone/menaquinone biosynthesis C-methylase UbiE